MRIPSGSTDRKLAFVAVDATDLKTRETGLSGFTVYRSRDGGTATAYTTPTVAELSAANMPGVYVLTLDEDTTIAAGHDDEEYVVHITHASMAPVTRAIDIYRVKFTEGQSAVMANNCVDADVERNAGAVITASAGRQEVNTSHVGGTLQTAGDIVARLPAALVGGRMDASVGNYQSGQAPLQPTVAGRTLDVTTTGEAGIDLDNTAGSLAKGTEITGFNDLDAAGVRSAVGLAAANLDAQLDALPTGAENADAVWDEALSGHLTGGTAGLALRKAEELVARYGTAQGGGASTITLDAGASAVNDYYKPGLIAIVSGTGEDQFRRISAYDGTTKVVTVATPWNTVPDGASVFVIMPWATVRVSEMDDVVIDAILDEPIDGAVTMRQLLRGFAAALLGKVSGMDTNAPKFRDLGDTKNRIDATTDANGNRSVVTLDLA